MHSHMHIFIVHFSRVFVSEADVVILSCVRSNSHRDMGFLQGRAGRRRINVAISRAKKRLIIVGNRSTFSNSRLWSQLL